VLDLGFELLEVRQAAPRGQLPRTPQAVGLAVMAGVVASMLEALNPETHNPGNSRAAELPGFLQDLLLFLGYHPGAARSRAGATPGRLWFPVWFFHAESVRVARSGGQRETSSRGITHLVCCVSKFYRHTTSHNEIVSLRLFRVVPCPPPPIGGWLRNTEQRLWFCVYTESGSRGFAFSGRCSGR